MKKQYLRHLTSNLHYADVEFHIEMVNPQPSDRGFQYSAISDHRRNVDPECLLLLHEGLTCQL